MFSKVNIYRLMPWAWSIAWMLTIVGATISNIYSSPPGSLVAYFGISAIGWIGAGWITVKALKPKSGMVIQLVAWIITYLVAIPVGLAWMLSRDMVPYLLFLPMVLAGAIGGLASSLRPGLWRLASGVLVGLVYFVFFTIGFYAGYILTLIYGSQPYVDIGNYYTLIWALPEGIFGLLTGLLTRWMLGIKPISTASDSPNTGMND
jgi:hypothetical protein